MQLIILEVPIRLICKLMIFLIAIFLWPHSIDTGNISITRYNFINQWNLSIEVNSEERQATHRRAEKAAEQAAQKSAEQAAEGSASAATLICYQTTRAGWLPFLHNHLYITTTILQKWPSKSMVWLDLLLVGSPTWRVRLWGWTTKWWHVTWWKEKTRHQNTWR